MGAESLLHVLMVSFPGQGHINPLLRLGLRLASKGLLVTLTTTETVGKQMRKACSIVAGEAKPLGSGFIRFEFFDDKWGEAEPTTNQLADYMKHLETVGSLEIKKMIEKFDKEENRPVSCLINNPFLPWVTEVAKGVGLPSALLWVQSCACFASYYHYHHNLVRFPDKTDPELDVHVPCMPVLKYDEIPSFLHPLSPFEFLKNAILGQFKNLENPFCVLIETFESLEHDILDYMSKFIQVKPVGPLLKNPTAVNSAVRGDLMEVAHDCIEWLDTKPKGSVVYVSFGSVVNLKQEEVTEIAHGLMNSGLCFLWVVKPNKDLGFQAHALPEGFLEQTAERGKVVQWSLQERVLAHPSVACFVTHCGWNSTMEALSSGVPVVAFPQWGDQVTNALYLVEVFKVGVRMSRGAAEGKIVKRNEVEKCLLEATVGPKAEELKTNALRWKEEAEAAVADGGSSDKNIDAFIDELRNKHVVSST